MTVIILYMVEQKAYHSSRHLKIILIFIRELIDFFFKKKIATKFIKIIKKKL